MRKKLVIVISFLFLFLYSFSSIFWGDKNLGKGYFLWRDGRYKAIVYNPNSNTPDGGNPITIDNVVSLNYNKNYIIFKTNKFIKPSTEIKEYWIIDKSIQITINDYNDQNITDSLLKVNLLGPLDSTRFYKLIKERNIGLELKEVK